MRRHAVGAAIAAVALLAAQAPSVRADQVATTVIPRLGVSPVIGRIPSTARLRAHAKQLIAAAKTLHLSEGESSALADALESDPRVLQYGPIPRHLDAMTSGGPQGYHAIRDVVIPAHQYGWHLTFSHGSKRTDFYIPNACGNVSIVRSVVKAAAVHVPPVPVPTPVPTVAPTAAPPTAAPAETAPPPSPAPTWGPNKAKRWQPIWWILGACVVSSILNGGFHNFCGIGPRGGGGSRPKHTPTPGPKPTKTPHPHPTPTPTNTPRPTPTPKPTTTPRPTPTPTTTPRPTPTPTTTPRPTPTPTTTPRPTPTPTTTPRPTPTPTTTPRPTPTPTTTPYPTPTPTTTPSPTPMPSWTPSPTPMPTWTPMPTPTPTICPPAQPAAVLAPSIVLKWAAPKPAARWENLTQALEAPSAPAKTTGPWDWMKDVIDGLIPH